MATSDGPTERSSTSLIYEFPFTKVAVNSWQAPGGRHRNWPVVYTLNNDRDVYIGESSNAVGRMRQHLESQEKKDLRSLRVVLDETYNKSVCLDLESFLIRMFSGDGKFRVLNRNDGVTDSDYFQREEYQRTFESVFEQLRSEGLFERRIAEIENSDLFKLSPFKALSKDQEVVIEDILEGLFEDLASDTASTVVVEGGPGTGKTIVGIYLLKLLADISTRNDHDNEETESLFSEFFVAGYPELLTGARIGLVVPQQSLRKSVQRVFARTPGLSKAMVLTPYDVGRSTEIFDLLIVDETHRLTQLAAQSMGTLTRAYKEISQELAASGEAWTDLTQIDWIIRKSKHQVFLLDEGQGVRPADVPPHSLNRLRRAALDSQRKYRLQSQMRVRAGDDYVGYIREVLSDLPPPAPHSFANYDLRFFDDASAMYDAILQREAEVGLSRLVAGYAWKWVSREGPGVFDIEVDGLQLCWNRAPVDWINSPTSIEEVGSIHTVQGYDLNYCGVIIGRDLYFDTATQRVRFDRDNYFDTKGKSNNGIQGVDYSDDEIRALVRNIYTVLLTRGMRGTYLYVCDSALREHLRPYFPAA